MTPSVASHFSSDARAVVRSLRSAFAELVGAAGADPRDPQSIAAVVGINKNLAWKVAKIIRADDPSVALKQMPGAAGVRIFLTAMERAGSPADLIETARSAISAYDRLIQTHSGDRATLEMMGEDLGPAGRRKRDEHHRKLLFQGASYVWGVRARVVLKVAVVGPGAAPGLLDFVSLSGLIDFRRLRQDVRWILATRRANNDDGSEMAVPAQESVDPRFGSSLQPPFIEEFCSRPLPDLHRIAGPTSTSFELPEGPVGKVGEVTCVFGTVQRGIPYLRTPLNEWGEHSASCDIPAELMVLDLFFHERFTFAMPPEPVLYSELGGANPFAARELERRRLPLNETLEDLGQSDLAPATPEVPRYSAMVRTLFDRAGWRPAEFRGFRMRIAYPACPAALVLRYRLPESAS